MDPQEMPDKFTPLSLQEGINALALGWKIYFGALPDQPEKFLTLAAQSILETGWFHAMHCYNFGNVKARPGGAWSWTFFACNEILAVPQANEAVRRSSPAAPAKISFYTKDGDAIVWFYPKHPGCCFRAFGSAELGAADHVALLNSPRFDPAWHFVDDDDVSGFALELHRLGYYTANPQDYARGCVQIFQQLQDYVARGLLSLDLDDPVIPHELAIQAIALRDASLRDGAFVEHEYPEVSTDEA